MNKLGIGIIGLGNAGKMHAKSILTDTHLGEMARLVAVQRRSSMSAQDYEEIFGRDGNVVVYKSLKDLLENPEVDVVHVTSVSGEHTEHTIQAANAGKNVICEKPVGITLESIDAAIEACEENGVQFAAFHQQRFNPCIVRLYELIEQGVLGEIGYGSVKCSLFRESPYYNGSWHGTLKWDGGGALMNQSIHYIDIAQWLMRKPAEKIEVGMTKRKLHKGIEAEDWGFGLVKLNGGAHISIEGGTCFEKPEGESLYLIGESGHVEILQGSIKEAWWDGKNQTNQFPKNANLVTQTNSPQISLENHGRYLNATYRALLDGKPVPISGRDGRMSVEIILAIYKAAEMQGEVILPLKASYSPDPKYVMN